MCTSSWAQSPRVWCSSTWTLWVRPARSCPQALPAPVLRPCPCLTLTLPVCSPAVLICRVSLHATLLGPGLPPLPLGLLVYRHHPPGGGEHDKGSVSSGEWRAQGLEVVRARLGARLPVPSLGSCAGCRTYSGMTWTTWMAGGTLPSTRTASQTFRPLYVSCTRAAGGTY
jgi:hypothetical protein